MKGHIRYGAHGQAYDLQTGNLITLGASIKHEVESLDVGARNRLAKWSGCKKPLDYEGVARATRRWEPYAGMVYFHLLLEGLSEAGQLK